MNPSYRTEFILFIWLAAVSLVAWAALAVVTRGWALVGLAAAAGFLVFVRSRYRAELRGTAVRLSANQSPELAARLARCCERLGLGAAPDGYLVRHGRRPELARRWLAPRSVVLDADLVESLADRPGAVDFLIGRELGRIRGRHALWDAFVAPASVLPLLGTAYRRAAEYRLDRYGAACADSDDDVAAALATLAAGPEPARALNRAAYLEQVNDTRGFAASFHELTSDSPWLTKRLAAALAFRSGRRAQRARPHVLAWGPALLVPRLGPTGTGALGTLVKLAGVAVVAVIGVREYADHRFRARIAAAFEAAQPVLDDVERYALENDFWPDSLADLGYAEDELGGAPTGTAIAVHPGGIVGIDTGRERGGWTSYVVLEPALEGETFDWLCYGQDLDEKYLPEICH